jgi:hypothetical protein
MLGSHFRTIVIGIKVLGAVTICYLRRGGDQPKARQARSFIPTTRGLLIILYIALWNQAVGGAADYFLLNGNRQSSKLPYGVNLLSRDSRVQSISKIPLTLETTTATIVDNTVTLLRRVPDPMPLDSENDLLSPSHHLHFFEGLERNDFASRQEEATSTLPDESTQSTPATLLNSPEEIIVPREQESRQEQAIIILPDEPVQTATATLLSSPREQKFQPLLLSEEATTTKSENVLNRTKSQIQDAITLLKENVQVHKLRRQQLNASTNIWPDFDLLHGTMLD